DVHKLLDNHKESYALDAASRAGSLSDDKKAFRNESWVDQLVKQSAQLAETYDKQEQWLKAMRLYADLSSIDFSNPEWKDKLKLVTRRIRLLALYTSGGIKALQESELKEREEVDKLLHPATQPTTQAGDKPTDKLVKSATARPTTTTGPADDDQVDAFKIDWHETVRGVKADML